MKTLLVMAVFVNFAVAQTIKIEIVAEPKTPTIKYVEVMPTKTPMIKYVEVMPTKRYYIENAPVFVQQPQIILAQPVVLKTYRAGLFGSTEVYENGTRIRRGMFGRVISID